MDIALFAFLFIVIAFAFQGYKKGVFITLSRLIGLPVAYLLSWLLFKPVGLLLQKSQLIEGLLAYALAGATVFIVSFIGISALFSLLNHIVVKSSSTSNQASALGGAAIGAVLGVIFGLLGVWFSTTIQTVIKTKLGKAHEMSSFEAKVNSLTQSTIRSIAMDREEPKISTLPVIILANPAENIPLMQKVAEKGLFQDLLADRNARLHLNGLSPATLIRNPKFRKLASDPDFNQLTKQMNFSDDPKQLERQLAMQITETWAKVRTVQDDPAFKSLIEDTEVRQLLQDKNLYQLSTHPKVEKLMNLINSVETPNIVFDENLPAENTAGHQQEEKNNAHKVYRWVDENGKVHYSDKKPDDKN